MIAIPYCVSPAPVGESVQPAQLATPLDQRDREPLRHILLGSPAQVQHTIHHLHVLNYVDQSFWSGLIVVPRSGIVITPAQGEVMSYMVRYRPRL